MSETVPTQNERHARTRRRRAPSFKPLAPTALVILAVIFVVAIILFIAGEIFLRDRVILGVSVLGQSIQGQTRAEAKQVLQKHFGEPDAILARYGREPIAVRDADLGRSWRAYPWELGLRTDFDPVAEVAIQLGHRGSIPEMLIEQMRCLVFGCDIGTGAQFDEYTARAYLGWLAPQVDRPARDASLRIQGLRVVTTPAQNGRQLDGTAMMHEMEQRILSGDRGDIVIPFKETAPLVTNIDAAKSQAEAILAAPVLLTFGGRSWAMDQAQLASLISIQTKPDKDGKINIQVVLNHERIVAQLKPIARDLSQPARDARFHFDNNVLTPIIPSQWGQSLDPETAAKQIEQQLLLLKSNDVNARVLALPVNTTKPTIAMEDAAKIGIKELVVSGTSNFKGSGAGRVQNIKTATEQFDGVVVPPGGTFSFDQFLGEVVEANGYDDAYIIFADRTVLGPGGGVCQVSSTVFRAAFFGGFPIVERWAHAYRVSYYEPPMGLDATVFAPTVDLKFTNDTSAYLLIEPKLDLKNLTLTINFYGTKPNRTVEMEEPIVEKVVPHGPAIYTDDPTLKKGVTKQIDFAHDGADVTVYRKIMVNGQLVKRDKFFSRYEPWVARYLVGTKK